MGDYLAMVVSEGDMDAVITSRKIHDASEMLPKTPDRASWAVSGGPSARTVTFMALRGFGEGIGRRGGCGG